MPWAKFHVAVSPTPTLTVIGTKAKFLTVTEAVLGTDVCVGVGGDIGDGTGVGDCTGIGVGTTVGVGIGVVLVWLQV